MKNNEGIEYASVNSVVCKFDEYMAYLQIGTDCYLIDSVELDNDLLTICMNEVNKQRSAIYGNKV